MKKADIFTGIILLVLSGYMIVVSSQMKSPGSLGTGAGFLPFWLGVALAVLSVVLIVSARRYPIDVANRSPFPAKQAFISIMLVLAGLAGYIMLMERLGFIVNTFLFVTFLMKVVERAHWRKSLQVSVLATGALYVVFQVLLSIGLPKNMFGF
jgi:putative tricarboxylic transport membrane protein